MSDAAKPTAIQLLEGVVQRATGKTAQELREQPISDLRKAVEARAKRRLQFTRTLLFIGRGSVLCDKTVNHDQVETLLDDALRE